MFRSVLKQAVERLQEDLLPEAVFREQCQEIDEQA